MEKSISKRLENNIQILQLRLNVEIFPLCVKIVDSKITSYFISDLIIIGIIVPGIKIVAIFLQSQYYKKMKFVIIRNFIVDITFN